jgi:hypothetical protein
VLGRVPTIGRSLAVTALVAAATAAGCGGGSDESPPPESSTCGYLYEWTSAWRLPLQPDPHAAYSYVIPKVTSEPIGFVISGPSPYAAWTSWTIYNGKFQPFSVVEDDAIKADKGSVNPFVPGNRVLSENRNFELLVLPHGTDTTRVAQSLRDIPAANRLASPTSGKFFVIADRVYNAFPGYNRGGAAGPTKTPFPTVKAVNYETGDGVDCSKQNLLPSPKPPTEMPATAETKSPSPARVELADGTTLSIGSDAVGGNSALKRAQYAPELDPDRIEMTRPPLLPGADVSSIPPPDNCAGYLGAQTSPQKIGLIRLPHVARWFDTERLTPKTPFEQRQTTYISFTEYGAETQVYQPGSPDSGSLGNAELQVDSSGGATIVVWPEGLKPAQQKQVFAYAKRNDWALIRGGERGPVTTPNLFVRLKGASDTYPGRYSPTSEAKGVPCYFDEHPKAKRWSDLTGERYVASGRNIGPGAPQGVNCTASQFLGGSCLESLKAYIRQTGGSYVAG